MCALQLSKRLSSQVSRKRKLDISIKVTVKASCDRWFIYDVMDQIFYDVIKQ